MRTYRKLVLCILILMVFAGKAHAQFVDGTKGLLCMPSAEFEEEATFMITNNLLNRAFLPKDGWNYNTFGYYFDITFWSRLEIAYGCTIFNGKWDPNYEKLSKRGQIVFNQDRHFAARVHLLKDEEFGQKWIPDLAIGVSDPVTGGSHDYVGSDVSGDGNGFFNRYYITASKHFNTGGGVVAGHLGYQYSKRKDGMPTGIQAAITWEPVWLNNPDWFMNNFRVTLEYDARCVNLGINASVWKNRFEVMAMLFDMSNFMVGARFKVVLKH